MGTYSEMLKERVSTLIEVVEPKLMERRMEVLQAREIENKTRR
ncbi:MULTISPECIES: hypothetical protein [unclassified Nitrobacter]|jgi:hypothetical protein|nr:MULTISPECIES: hypothetical protein [unclassified Nitrobacter]